MTAGPAVAPCADGELRADQPELLIYELRGGRLRPLGAEYLVFVDWNPTLSCIEYGGELAAFHGDK